MDSPRETKSKHAKYKSQNPISRYLVRSFLKTIERLVVPLHPRTLLDVGCGEGMVLKSLEGHLTETRCAAIDLDPVEAADAARNLPWCDVHVGSVYELPFDEDSFDLVVCSEVLEHVDDPVKALAELKRVTSNHALLSVPREPLWRTFNMVRGAYLKDWGNTPGHLNHWSVGAFESFVGTEFEIIRRVNPLPWTVILARKR